MKFACVPIFKTYCMFVGLKNAPYVLPFDVLGLGVLTVLGFAWARTYRMDA